ncbi:hypothetical protein [Rhizobium leguminosarum]|uniref:hypothetical protein n=1 Tax=Rhizobium leguminosarum TaxID=384 RepID=UPI0021B0C023|nr:hypothetical protein [Rhizobium leguminosarum]
MPDVRHRLPVESDDHVVRLQAGLCRDRTLADGHAGEWLSLFQRGLPPIDVPALYATEGQIVFIVAKFELLICRVLAPGSNCDDRQGALSVR